MRSCKSYRRSYLSIGEVCAAALQQAANPLQGTRCRFIAADQGAVLFTTPSLQIAAHQRFRPDEQLNLDCRLLGRQGAAAHHSGASSSSSAALEAAAAAAAMVQGTLCNARSPIVWQMIAHRQRVVSHPAHAPWYLLHQVHQGHH